MSRPKHPRADLEAVLRRAEELGWRVTRGKYFKMKCPCDKLHIKTVHLSPSGRNYTKNLRHKLTRDTCWEAE